MPKKTVTETRLYPVILHREGNSWGYFSPEFGGGGAATFADALRLAQELLDSEVSRLAEAGEAIPEPTDESDLDPEGGKITWLPVEISNAAERIFITLPKSLIAQIDATTGNRSAFFAELARERFRHQESG